MEVISEEKGRQSITRKGGRGRNEDNLEPQRKKGLSTRLFITRTLVFIRLAMVRKILSYLSGKMEIHRGGMKGRVLKTDPRVSGSACEGGNFGGGEQREKWLSCTRDTKRVGGVNKSRTQIQPGRQRRRNDEMVE